MARSHKNFVQIVNHMSQKTCESDILYISLILHSWIYISIIINEPLRPDVLKNEYVAEYFIIFT